MNYEANRACARPTTCTHVELDGAAGQRKTALAYAAALCRHPNRRRHTQTRKQKRDAGTSAIAAEEEGPEIPRQRGRAEWLARIWNWLTLGTVGNVAMGVITESLRDPQTLLSFANVFSLRDTQTLPSFANVFRAQRRIRL